MNRFFASFLFLCVALHSSAQAPAPAHTMILPGYNNDLVTLSVSPKAGLMATAGWDNQINIYTSDSPFTLVQTLKAHAARINTLRFNRSGTMLASGSNDFTVLVFDSVFNKKKLESPDKGHKGYVNTVLFDNSSRFLFSGADDGKICMWDISKGICFRNIDVGARVTSLAMGRDPRVVIAASANPQIKVINLTNGQTQRVFAGHTDAVNAIEVSPNGKYLLSGSNDKSARIWDLATGQELRKLTVNCWKVLSVAFSENGKYCATACNDGSIKVWEVESGLLISSVEAQNYNAFGIVFSKNMFHMAVAPVLRGGNDYGVRIYPLDFARPKPKPADTLRAKKTKGQLALDSIIKIRKPTKLDSVKYKIRPATVTMPVQPVMEQPAEITEPQPEASPENNGQQPVPPAVNKSKRRPR